jgi:peptide/nickel transport system permease protein
MAATAPRLHLPKPVLGTLSGRSGVVVAVTFVLAALAAAVFGAWLAPHDPNATNLSAAFQSPSLAHLLGTDGSGRDVLSRVLAGARSAVLAPLCVAAVGTAAGTAVGLFSVWYGGFADRLIARGLDMIFAFPGLLVAILAVAMFGKGLIAPVLALSVVYLPYVARVIRSVAIRERHLPYIDALVLQGASTFRVVTRHLLPNVAAVVAAQSVLAFSYALIDLATINYLGLGIQPPGADWGVMVAEGQASILDGHYAEALFACLCIVCLIVAVQILAERLSGDALEVPR